MLTKASRIVGPTFRFISDQSTHLKLSNLSSRKLSFSSFNSITKLETVQQSITKYVEPSYGVMLCRCIRNFEGRRLFSTNKFLESRIDCSEASWEMGKFPKESIFECSSPKSQTTEMVMPNKHLVAFDFDHTIIDDNSDLYVRKLAPNGEIPKRIHDLYDDSGWTEYMASIFEYLHDNGTTPNEILDCMTEIAFTSGMTELLAFLAGDSFDVIIISDSNSVFIEHIMKHAGLQDIVNEVYTNPAHFNASGRLELAYYHTQDWCQLSTRNLCKGHILVEHIKEQEETGGKYSSVVYVGDGSNDLCPSLKLTANDLVFPRTGFTLAKKVESYKDELRAKVVPWSTGLDILNELQKLHV